MVKSEWPRYPSRYGLQAPQRSRRCARRRPKPWRCGCCGRWRRAGPWAPEVPNGSPVCCHKRVYTPYTRYTSYIYISYIIYIYIDIVILRYSISIKNKSINICIYIVHIYIYIVLHILLIWSIYEVRIIPLCCMCVVDIPHITICYVSQFHAMK